MNEEHFEQQLRHCFGMVWEKEEAGRSTNSETFLVPNKAAASYHFLRGGWDDPNCARPTRAFRGRALREHVDRPSYPAHFSAS